MRLILIFFLINLLKVSFSNNIALPCYGCHISNNNKSNNSIPMIEGIDKKYFITAFHEYKNKEGAKRFEKGGRRSKEITKSVCRPSTTI